MLRTKQLMSDSYKILNSLTPDNGKFFFDLMSYLRTKGLFKNAFNLELKINEIANDLKKADLDGLSAETFFGNQPKEMAQDILNVLPNDKITNIFKKYILLFLTFLCIIPFTFSSYTNEINGIEHRYISLLTALIMTSYTIIFMIIISIIISRSVFNQKKRKTRPYLIWFTILTPYIIPILLRLYHVNIWQFEIPTYLYSAAITIAFVSLIAFYLIHYPLIEIFKTRNRF